MLKQAEIIDQFKRKNAIFINVQNCNKSHIILVVEMHVKLVENNNNIQFNKMFAFDDLFNDLFYQKQKISISLYYDIKFLIINAESQIFVDFHYK